MNTALILAAGVGQRMRNSGLPKQFISLNGKPIIIYTLEKFENCSEIDQIVIVCREGYVDRLKKLISQFDISKVNQIIIGGSDRQESLMNGLISIQNAGAKDTDIVVIHDGVRPLVSNNVIMENIRVAKAEGAAMTVHPVTESVTVTNTEYTELERFQKRADTYSLTSPQSFQIGLIMKAYSLMKKEKGKPEESQQVPLLDAAMVYAKYIGTVHMVKDLNSNIKITTPEDFYFLKAMLEMEEHKFIFGL